jgi:hypothetical protein
MQQNQLIQVFATCAKMQRRLMLKATQVQFLKMSLLPIQTGVAVTVGTLTLTMLALIATYQTLKEMSRKPGTPVPTQKK